MPKWFFTVLLSALLYPLVLSDVSNTQYVVLYGHIGLGLTLCMLVAFSGGISCCGLSILKNLLKICPNEPRHKLIDILCLASLTSAFFSVDLIFLYKEVRPDLSWSLELLFVTGLPVFLASFLASGLVSVFYRR